MSNSLTHYTKTIKQALEAGNATEHTHRPTLKALLEALDLGIIATNEPKHIACGAPDYVVTRDRLIVGYIEAKDVGKSLSEVERSPQLKRYLGSLNNLILTDYLEFCWYVGGERRETARLARIGPDGKLKSEKGGAQAVENLLRAFLDHTPEPINTPRDLAVRMARLTHMVRDVIIEAFNQGQASSLLQGWREAFAKVLIADLDQPDKTADFADMFAQTLAYGLFSARVMDPTPADFSRQEAQRLIPKTNPFLRDFFYQISGPQLDDEPFGSFVDDLVNLLAHTDMAAILTDFGRRTRQEDPVVHFYETFLAAYDPKLREARGVYYTPEPVVSYIVRSVDHLLKTRFNCPQGLADSSMITVPNLDPGLTVKGTTKTRKTAESHKVLILDPACGTGTFLYAVIDHIRQQFMQQGNAGMWPGYVKNHLLPRLFGFELLMAPYAVAHFKLSLQLAGRDLPDTLAEQWAYHPGEGERLGIYLTNALEEAHEMTGMPLFTQWVADETNAANEVKRHLPVLVVMGNPPYSVSSSNKGEHIEQLMETYKKAVRHERNIQPLSDDYIKFIRFAHDRIERTEQGIIGIITNHAYLFSPVHRGMREELMKSFDDIYILNLHGNALLTDTTPGGSSDQNVFDIRQGVSIAILVKMSKKSNLAEVHYAEVWGERESKYQYLSKNDVSQTAWQELKPEAPYFFFISKDLDLLDEFGKGWSMTKLTTYSSTGVGTGRDSAFVAFDKESVNSFVQDLANDAIPDNLITEKYNVRDTSGWNFFLRRQTLMGKNVNEKIVPYQYRPFDLRFTFYHPIIRRDQRQMMRHMTQKNFMLLVCQQQASLGFRHVFCTRHIVDESIISNRTRERGYCFPLYLYPTDATSRQKSMLDTSTWPPGENGRVPNLNPDFVTDLEKRLGLTFTSEGSGDLETTFDPEDIFHYIYAVFHSPTYRSRYAEFLKIDFPRVPLTSDVKLFRTLGKLGQELVSLHLLESPAVSQFITRYPRPGDNRVEKGYPKYAPPQQGQPGRVNINKEQYFEGVPPEVWAFQVGGYQVCDKWLKDRRGRQLSYDELTHYQQVIVALKETIRLMAEIDEAIPEWPIE